MDDTQTPNPVLVQLKRDNPFYVESQLDFSGRFMHGFANGALWGQGDNFFGTLHGLIPFTSKTGAQYRAEGAALSAASDGVVYRIGEFTGSIMGGAAEFKLGRAALSWAGSRFAPRAIIGSAVSGVGRLVGATVRGAGRLIGGAVQDAGDLIKGIGQSILGTRGYYSASASWAQSIGRGLGNLTYPVLHPFKTVSAIWRTAWTGAAATVGYTAWDIHHNDKPLTDPTAWIESGAKTIQQGEQLLTKGENIYETSKQKIDSVLSTATGAISSAYNSFTSFFSTPAYAGPAATAVISPKVISTEPAKTPDKAAGTLPLAIVDPEIASTLKLMGYDKFLEKGEPGKEAYLSLAKTLSGANPEKLAEFNKIMKDETKKAFGGVDPSKSTPEFMTKLLTGVGTFAEGIDKQMSERIPKVGTAQSPEEFGRVMDKMMKEGEAVSKKLESIPTTTTATPATAPAKPAPVSAAPHHKHVTRATADNGGDRPYKPGEQEDAETAALDRETLAAGPQIIPNPRVAGRDYRQQNMTPGISPPPPAVKAAPTSVPINGNRADFFNPLKTAEPYALISDEQKKAYGADKIDWKNPEHMRIYNQRNSFGLDKSNG